ncbi:MAG: hypothetical protein R6X20_00920 [Phycisphaerae bacterium]
MQRTSPSQSTGRKAGTGAAAAVMTAALLGRSAAAGGKETVKALVEQVGDTFGAEDGVQAKYALHGLVIWAGRPHRSVDEVLEAIPLTDGEAGEDAVADALHAPAVDRRLVAGTLAEELAAEHSKELKAFLCRQLQWCGEAEDVPALAALLADDRLCEPATQALLAIGGEAATRALRDALPKAEGGRRVTILKAVGRLEDADSAAEARKDIGAEDRDLRLTALWALAKMGDGQAAEAERDAASADPSFAQRMAFAAALLLARRLGESGKTDAAEAICRRCMEQAERREAVHERLAALDALGDVLGPKAVGDVLKALDSKDLRYRVPAARTALRLAKAIRKKDRDASDRLLKKIPDATGEGFVRQDAERLLAGKPV